MNIEKFDLGKGHSFSSNGWKVKLSEAQGSEALFVLTCLVNHANHPGLSENDTINVLRYKGTTIPFVNILVEDVSVGQVLLSTVPKTDNAGEPHYRGHGL